jgi:hypothetical protein
MVSIKLKKLTRITPSVKSFGFILGTSMMITTLMSCGGGSSVENESTTVLEPTQGVVTTLKEMEADLFRITDEDIVATKDDSRIIAQYLDGKIDTFTLDQAQIVDAENPRRGGAMRGVLMGGMMGYMMGKSMSTPISSGAYANNAAFNKSNTANNSLRSTASKRTVSTPKKGFGSSKSTKSYGG